MSIEKHKILILPTVI